MEQSLHMDKQVLEKPTQSLDKNLYKVQDSYTGVSEKSLIISNSIKFRPTSSVRWQNSTKSK
jgi:hypothetical protein